MNKSCISLLALIFTLILLSCTEAEKRNATNNPLNHHTASNFQSVATKHLDLNLNVDFENKTLKGCASWTIENPSQDSLLILDTDDLTIDSVTLNNNTNEPAFYKLDYISSNIGTALSIKIKPNTQSVQIYYQTKYYAGDSLCALQWFCKEQTFDKKAPFLYSSSEPQMTRCWIPCQDVPTNRITYNATIHARKDLMAVMSAENNPQSLQNGTYTFQMKQPIPTYLIALAVGNLSFMPINEKCGIYSEPSLIHKSLKEFSELPQMLSKAESLYGKYEWERFDLVVLPLGYPIGGMENPQLTFITPTVITGDKSQLAILSHELAHSWSGNLVTNATWSDLWVNEGLTVYIERRITEAVRSKREADIEWFIGKMALENALETLDYNAETKLKNDNHEDPLTFFTEIPYEKGAYFFKMIEDNVGRKELDAFIRKLFNEFRFKSLSTDEFIVFLEKELLSKNREWKKKINHKEWIFKPGIPDNISKIEQSPLLEVDEAFEKFSKTKTTQNLDTKNWVTQEWVHFLNKLHSNSRKSVLAELDRTYNFTNTTNSATFTSWAIAAIHADYEPIYEPLGRFLKSTGRLKYIAPLYRTLITTPEGKKFAQNNFAISRSNYHPIAQLRISNIVK